MKTTSTLFIAAILITGIIGFFLGRTFPAKQVASTPIPTKQIAEKTKTVVKAPAVVDPVDPPTNEVEEPATPTAVVAGVASTESTGSTPAPETTTASTPSPEPIKLPSTVGRAELARVNTGISDQKIGEVLRSVSDNLEAKRLSYVSSLSQDCSGIFHQLKDSLQTRLPGLNPNSGYEYPSYKTVRSSRQIANWYHENDNLLIVEDPLVSKNSIRPGSVMFYGRSNEKFRNLTIETLTDKDNNFTRNGAIMHIAVVTSVKRNKDTGDVESYMIMHGRNKRVHASRSGSKEIQSRNTKGLPAFGNWSQQWVAIANMATKK